VHRHVAAERSQRLRAPVDSSATITPMRPSRHELAVDVVSDDAVGHVQSGGPAQRYVLADSGDGVGDRCATVRRRIMRALDRLGVDVGRLVERDRDDPWTSDWKSSLRRRSRSRN